MSLLERLWYNYQYIYNDIVQPLRQGYLHVPINSLPEITGHRVFVINDAAQNLKQLYNKGVVEFLVKKKRNIKNSEIPESISLGILVKSTSKDNYTIKYPLTVEIKYQLRMEIKH